MTPAYKARKENTKITSRSPSLVNPALVQILGQAKKEKAIESTTTSKKKAASEKPTLSKEASKKKSSMSSTTFSSDDIRALDEKWSQHFARLESVLLAKTFTMPVSPVKQPATVVTSEKPFIPPDQPTAGTSTAIQSAGPVTQITGSHVQLLSVPVVQCCSLLDQSARYLPAKATLLLFPVRCLCHSLLVRPPSLLPGKRQMTAGSSEHVLFAAHRTGQPGYLQSDSYQQEGTSHWFVVCYCLTGH